MMRYRKRASRHFISLLTLLACGIGGATPAAPSEPPRQPIYCKATHWLSCKKDACERTADNSLYVELMLDLTRSVGDLCTFTYCRDIQWLRVAGDTGPQTIGAVRSADSGSVQEDRGKPIIDYFLWVGPDRNAFSLFRINEDGSSDGSGWTGQCGVMPEKRGSSP